MRVAICFSGLVGSTKGKSQELRGDPKKCLELSSAHYKKHILEKNNVDVFIHSWSKDLEEEIIETYAPKKYLIEKQIIFDTPKYNILSKTEEIRKQTHYSLWYSRKKAVELKSQYEKEHGFKYDCVMLARFDLAWQTDLVFEDYDQEYFWSQAWPKKVLNGKKIKDVDYWKLKDKPSFKDHQWETVWWGYPRKPSAGVLGMWFFSNSEAIDKFVTLYDHLDEYSKPGNCPLDSDGRMSAHMQIPYHLEKLNMLDKLKFCKNWHDDCPSVRRFYFKTR